MVAITLIDKHTAQKTAATESHLALTRPTVVQVEVRRADVSAIERSGNALVLRLKNGEVLTIDNYFVPAGQPVNDLVLIEDRGALWWLHFGEGPAGWTFAPLDSIEPLLLVDQSEAAWVFLPLLVGAVVASDSDGGSGGLNIKAQVNETGKIISGATTPGADVVVRDAHGNVLGQTQADANGHFELTLPRPLNHNEQVDVVGTDADGNTGTDKVTYIDTLAPEAPGAMTVTDDVVGIVGALQSGGLTNDNRPTFSGDGATPGDVIRLYDNGVLIGTGTVDANGHWTITPETGLNDGAHHFVATAVDPAGNESGPGTPFDLVIDTVPPGAPTIAPSDGSGLNGMAEPGSTVNIDINNDGTVDATAPVDGNGQWTYTPPSPLGDGTVVHVTATDPAGNTGPGADGTVDTNAPPPPPPPPPPPDTTPPAAPTITNADDNVAPGTGLLGSGATTNDNTPRLIGTAEPGSTVHVFQNGTEVGQVTAALNGSWSYTPAALTDGGYSFTATATDAAGNTSTASAPFTLTIDTTAPTATIAITAIADDTGTAGDFVTSDTSLTVSGTLTGTLGAGEKAQISIDGGVSWTDLTVAGGAWSYVDGRTLTNGAHVYDVRVVDLAGNVGSTDSQSVTVTTTGPTATIAITAIADDSGVAGDFVTNDTSLTVSGTLTGTLGAGEKAQISIDGGASWTDLTVAGGAWSYVDGRTLVDGNSYTYQVRVIDAASNVGSTDSRVVTIDTTAPTATIAITAIADDTGTAGDFVTSDTSLTVSGTLTGTLGAGEKAQISIDGGVSWTDLTVAGGAWSYVDGRTLVDGNSYTYQVRVIDAASNVGSTDSRVVTIDTTAPTATIAITAIADDTGTAGDFVTNDTSLTVSGTLTGALGAGEKAQISIDGGVSWTDLTVAGGAWSYVDGRTLTNGAHVYDVRVVDLAGNVGSTASQSVTVTTTGPTATIAITAIADDSGVASDFVTNDTSLTVSGTLTGALGAGEKAQISIDGGASWTDLTVAGGTWSYVDGRTLVDGNSYTYQVRVIDAASNVGSTDSQVVTIDTTAPTATIAITAIADDTGTAGDFVTSDTSLTVSGTLTGTLGAGEKAQISIDGGVSWTDLTVTGGAWSYVDGRTLTGGTYVYDVRVVDLAGNVGSTDSQLVSVDTAGNDAPTVVNALASVSEEGLPGGAADTTGVPGDTTNLATVNGTMVIADVDGTVTGLAVSGPGGLTSGGVAVTWSGSFAGGTYTLTGMAGADTVATLTVTTAGAYSFVLNQSLDHPVAGVEDVLGLGFAITATDDGGANGSGTLTIKVEDDMPVAADAAIFGVTAAPITITNSLVESFGADGGHVAQITIDGNTYVYDPVADTVAASGSSALVVSHSFNAGTNELTIETIKGETLVVNMQTGAYTYTATGVPVIPSEANVAPQVFLADTGGLLGIAGANVLGLIDISKQQAFAAVDANNNISKVEIVYDPALALGIQLAAASALATELGLQLSVVNETLLGLITKSTLTVEAIGGGAIDTLKLNEFLGTVFLSGGAIALDLLNTVSITATDTGGLTASASASNLLALNLLGATPPPVIMQGTAGDDAGAGSLTGDGDDNRIYGYAGNDTLAGDAGNDILRGGVGADSLDGGAGNDVVMGGAGADTLAGGTGNDLFRWEKGDQGTAGAAVVDTVNDFVFQPVSGGGDIIDLRNLLQGEGAIGSHPGNLSNYLHFEVVGGNTVLSISSTGGFLGGYQASAVDQQIVFNGVDLVGSLTTDEAVIAYLLSHGNLMVDPATADTNLLAGTTTVNAVVVDNDGDAATTSASFDSTGATPPTPDPTNVAPVVQVDTTALLGIVSADALNILGLDRQDLAAADANGNLKSVVVAYQPLLSVNLSPLQLTASSQLADELGLKITVVNDSGLLGLLAPSSVLTITALDGGVIDNLAVNELLATVHFDDAFNLLGVDVRLAVLDATTITATDSAGLTASASLGALLNANALNTLQGSATLIEGGAGNDTLTGGAENERLYGHDGDDVIAGNGGDDLIRGGAGNDNLDGGDGHDLLIDGNGADTINSGAGNDLILIAGTGWSSIDGGAGVDILRLDSGTGLLMNLDGSDGLANLERIDLGIGNAGHSLTLTEAGVLDATDINDILQITGDASDTVTMNGATFVAQTVVDGITFDQYTFGTATVLVEDPVMVVV